MAIFDTLTDDADDADDFFGQLTADNLIEPTNEWGLDNVWRLKLGGNEYADDKMHYPEQFLEKRTICLYFTAGGSNWDNIKDLAINRYYASNYDPKIHRGHRYFAKFSDKQYNSLWQLLHALCDCYHMPYKKEIDDEMRKSPQSNLGQQ
jgi:hypothetical protein